MSVENNKEVTPTKSTIVDKSKIEVRNISIVPSWTLLVKSLFRLDNAKMLEDRIDKIGSSINSVNSIISNKGLIDKYMPALLGLSPSNDEFVTAAKNWLSNISVGVGAQGITLDASFKYDDEKVADEFMQMHANIESNYEKADKQSDRDLIAAVRARCEATYKLEMEKYPYGVPVNIPEYLIYLHCLLYGDVAKDVEIIYRDANVRFYIKDEERSKRQQEKEVKVTNLAMKNYLELVGDENKMDAVFAIYCSRTNKPLIPLIYSPASDKQRMLLEYMRQQPNIFNNICADKYLLIRSFIEKLVSKQELIRSEYNQQISTPDGKIIGANMDAAIAFFSQPANIDFKNALAAKLKA